MGLKLLSLLNRSGSKPKSAVGRSPKKKHAAPAVDDFQPAAPTSPEADPLQRLFNQGRLRTILSEQPKWMAHPGGAAIVERAKDVLEQQMALVPAGSVNVSRTLTSQPGDPEEEFELPPFLLDVHCVTNARYQAFVDAGGYDALEFWPEEIWPHLIELRDLTGQPGPRYWRQGRHDLRFAQHPVVGVSWYEAQAFALWIGQRLPTEPEWQMAASWHIKSSMDVMRRFPWGDAMDAGRCNIWASRVGRTVPVDQYPNGAAPNQILQLIGNVWEWTDTEYTVADAGGKPVVGEMPMHVVRGGAFDTYFESQATSYFRTGQIALARTYNTGFRCAMNLADAAWLNDD